VSTLSVLAGMHWREETDPLPDGMSITPSLKEIAVLLN
jgi:hypothetical protein